MEDQTIQQAIILLKLIVLKKDRVKSSLVDLASIALVCLMIASKVQDSDMHLKVANVAQLIQKFIDDNSGKSAE